MIEDLIEELDVEIAKQRTALECVEEDTELFFAKGAVERTEENVRKGKRRVRVS